MATPIKKGQASIIVKPFDVFYDPRSGLVVRRQYSALTEAALLATEQAAQAAGYSTRKTVSNGLCTLETISPEASEGIAAVVTDNWQIVGNEVNESAFYAPVILSTISENDRTVISRAIKDGSKLSDAATVCGTDLGGTFTTPSAAAALQFYKELQKGQDSYSVGQFVLRHTTNASASSTYNISDVNVECLYTTAQLLSEINSTVLWVQPCPTRLRTKIAAIPSRVASGGEASYYSWRWKKSPSTETLTANNRIEITTEYVLYLWSTLRYSLAT